MKEAILGLVILVGIFACKALLMALYGALKGMFFFSMSMVKTFAPEKGKWLTDLSDKLDATHDRLQGVLSDEEMNNKYVQAYLTHKEDKAIKAATKNVVA